MKPSPYTLLPGMALLVATLVVATKGPWVVRALLLLMLVALGVVWGILCERYGWNAGRDAWRARRRTGSR